jgi:flagellin
MLGINSNINSLIAQQNLSASQSALSQAITRLSSGKRINSAADDAAGLAISNRMQTQINGLNQGVSNANDGVSMIQTASSGLSQITSSLQTIRTLAVQASSGSLSASDQAALQQEVSQQIAEVNRVASQTTYNGKNVLDGSAGNVNFQIGANVGQTINLDLSHSVSAANLGTGVVSAGSVVGTMTGLNLTAQGLANTGTGAAALTSINVLSDGKGGFSFTDQNNQALTSTAVTNLFGGAAANTGTGTPLTLVPQGALVSGASAAQTSAIAAAQVANAQITPGAFTANGKVLSTLTLTGGGLTTDLAGQSAGGTIKSIQISADGNGGYTFQALNAAGTDITSSINTGSATGSAALASLFATTTGSASTPGTIALTTAGANALGATDAATATGTTFAAASAANYVPPTYPTGFAKSGTVEGTISTAGKLKADLSAEGGTTPATDITSIQVLADGSGNFTYKALNAAGVDVTSSVTGGGKTGSAALATLFTPTAATGSTATAGTITSLSAAGILAFTVPADATAAGTSITAINAKNGTLNPIGTVSVNLDATGAAAAPGTTPAYTSVNIYANGSGGYTFKAVDASGAESGTAGVNTAAGALFSVGTSPVGTNGDTLTGKGALTANANGTAVAAGLAAVTANNTPGTVANLNVSTAAGANTAIESIDNALATVNNLQATLGAAQNRFTALSATQQAQSTDLSGAQSQITDANFAQETANLSKANVMQQAGISVLAQANSNPQQVLKLLQ